MRGWQRDLCGASEGGGVIVTAALAWFDEPLHELDGCVRSLATVADRLVAVDGGYSRFPGAAVSSAPEQAEVIRAAAADVGLDVSVVVPGRVWAGQCEKRSHMMRWAADGSDWVAVVDADWRFRGVRECVRAELERLPDDVVSVDVSFFTPANPNRDLAVSASCDWHAGLSGEVSAFPVLLRALPAFEVGPFHWWYSAEQAGRRVWVASGDGRYPMSRSVSFASDAGVNPVFYVEHRCLFREEKQIVANREFCADRDRLVAECGAEDPVGVGVLEGAGVVSTQGVFAGGVWEGGPASDPDWYTRWSA